MTEDDDIFDSTFHGCAFAAYVELAHEGQGVPDSQATRRRAYAYYEAELAKKNRQRTDAAQECELAE